MDNGILAMYNDISLQLFSSAVVYQDDNITMEQLEIISSKVKEHYATGDMITKTVMKDWIEVEKNSMNNTTWLRTVFHNACKLDNGNGDHTLDVDIAVMTEAAFVSRLRKLLYTNVAIQPDLANTIALLLYELDTDNEAAVEDIEAIGIKSVRSRLYTYTGILPSDPEALLEYIHNTITETSVVYVKNPETLNRFAVNAVDVCYKLSNYINNTVNGIEKLGSVFYRNKPVFMAIKSGLDTDVDAGYRTLINRIRRAASVNHVPIIEASYKNLLSVRRPEAEVLDILNKLDTTYLIKIMSGAMYRLEAVSRDFNLARYKIRNGLSVISTFSDTLTDVEYEDIADKIKTILKERISNNIVKHDITFINTTGLSIDLGLPVNTNKMLGGLPYGTTIDYPFTSDVMFGIYWTNDDNGGITDYDLAMSDNSVKVGWDGSPIVKDKYCTYMYSGDNTDAPNGASEVLYASSVGTGRAFEVTVSNYSSNSDVNGSYILSLANTKPDEGTFNTEYCMDVNDVFYSTKVTFAKGINTQTLGTLTSIDDVTRFTVSGAGSRYNVSTTLSDDDVMINEIVRNTAPKLSDVMDIEYVSTKQSETDGVVIDVTRPDINNLMLLVE